MSGKTFKDHFRDRTAQGGGSVDDIPDSRQDLIRVGGFQEISRGPIANGPINLLAIIESGQDNDLDIGKCLTNLRENRNAILLR